MDVTPRRDARLVAVRVGLAHAGIPMPSLAMHVTTMGWRWLGAVAIGGLAIGGACVIEGGPGPTATELYRLIDAHCESATRCSCAFTEGSTQACKEELEARWHQRLLLARDHGLHYDAACMDELVAQIEQYECYWPGGESPLCQRFCSPLHGDRAEGEACQALRDEDGLVSDCAQGLYCADGECMAPCRALGGRQRGEACASEALGPFDDCAAGLWCSWSSGVCEAPPGLGASCFDGSCAEGLYCRWETNTCVQASGAGGPCREASCAEGLYCDYGADACRPAGGVGADCWDLPCADDLYCAYSEFSGTAQCRAYAGEGEDCREVPCEEPLVCDEANVCAPAPEAGEPCAFGFLCATGLVCDLEDTSCALPPEEGEPCPEGTCAGRAWCDTSDPLGVGVCTARRALDEPCAGHRQCESNYCPNGFCWPAPLEGDDCQGTGACAPGLVCNGSTCEPTKSRAPAACSYPGW